MIKPTWIRTFRALVEVKNFTRVANKLDITQAAVSQHIQLLEKELGPLVIRTKRGIELMPKGKAFLEYCLEVEGADKRLENRLNEFDNTSGNVSVICPGSLGLRINPLLLNFQQQNENIYIHNRFAPDNEVIDQVLANHYEIGFVANRPDESRLNIEPFTQEGLELVVPADADVHDWADLMQLGFIDHPDGQSMASRVLSRLYPNEFSLSAVKRTGFSNQISLILEPVSRGFGFTVLPSYARQAFAKQDRIKVINTGETYKEQLWLIYRNEWPLSGKALNVIEYLRASLAN